MSLQKNTNLYEVLIRLENGTFKGAHKVSAEEILDNGKIISTKPLEAEAIDLKEAIALLQSLAKDK